MRKSDKKKNFLKVNLLAEQRYLQSKGVVSESFHGVDGKPIGVNEKHMPIKENNEMDLEANPALLNNIISQISDIVAPYIGINVADKAVANHNWEAILTAFNQRFSRNSKYKDEFGKEYSKNLEEDDLSDYRGEMLKTGDYPWSTFLGDKGKGEDEQTRNSEASKNFMQQFNRAYMGQTIETTNGVYAFSNIKYRNNHGNYDLIFTKPKGENDFMDKTLWIAYDPTDGYYMLDKQGDGIQLTDNESEQKVIEMLSYNK
jgi:hypothetical protein